MLKIDIIDALPDTALKIDNEVLINDISNEVMNSNSIILYFPSFTDGRAFSQARQLRRLGFKGDLIASGDIRADQVRHYAQVGFSKLYFNKKYDEKVIVEELNRYSVPYQKSFFGMDTVYQKRISNKKTLAV